MTDASTIRSPETPFTSKSGLTTPNCAFVADIEAVPTGCCAENAVLRIKSSSKSSVVAFARAPAGAMMKPSQAGPAKNLCADLINSRIAKSSNSVAKKFGSMRGLSNGLLVFSFTEPPGEVKSVTELAKSQCSYAIWALQLLLRSLPSYLLSAVQEG